MIGTTKLAAFAAALVITITSATPLSAQAGDSTVSPGARRQMSDSGGRRMRPMGPRGELRRGELRRGERGPGGRWDGDEGRARGRGGPGGPRGLLRDITLSDAQQKALRAVQVRHIAAAKPLQVDMISARADAQIARLNGDQKALDAATARLTAAREKLQQLGADRSPATDLRSILTPEQQKLLDRNLAEAAQRPAAMRGGPRDGMRGPGQGRRGFAPGRMGPRPDGDR